MGIESGPQFSPEQNIQDWKAPETGADTPPHTEETNSVESSETPTERDSFLESKKQIILEKHPNIDSKAMDEAMSNWGRIYDAAKNNTVEKLQIHNHEQFAQQYEATASDPSFSDSARQDAAREAAFRRQEVASLEADIAANPLGKPPVTVENATTTESPTLDKSENSPKP